MAPCCVSYKGLAGLHVLTRDRVVGGFQLHPKRSQIGDSRGLPLPTLFATNLAKGNDPRHPPPIVPDQEMAVTRHCLVVAAEDVAASVKPEKVHTPPDLSKE